MFSFLLLEFVSSRLISAAPASKLAWTMAPSLPKPHAIYIQQQRVKNGFTGEKGNAPAGKLPPATEPKNPAPPKP
jgi:hypothetical protein